MTRAIVCLSSGPDGLLGHILSTLQGLKVQVFNSLDEGFEQLWSDGRDIGLFILQLDAGHAEELWHATHSWPTLDFVAIYDGFIKLDEAGANLTVISKLKAVTDIEQELSRIVSRYTTKLFGI